ncbi:MAG TPA: chaperone modulator CbpM [Solirubrobacteraceae bacterium]
MATGTWLAAPGSGLVDIETLAHEAGIHPEVARRLMALGLTAPMGGTAGSPLFAREDGLLLARAVRLRRDLGLNYSGAVLACELLARIDELEQRLAQRHDEVMA